MPKTVSSDRWKTNFYIDGFVTTLHDRGVIDENALCAVLKDLLDGKPLTYAGLASVFGVEAIRNLFFEEGVL